MLFFLAACQSNPFNKTVFPLSPTEPTQMSASRPAFSCHFYALPEEFNCISLAIEGGRLAVGNLLICGREWIVEMRDAQIHWMNCLLTEITYLFVYIKFEHGNINLLVEKTVELARPLGAIV